MTLRPVIQARARHETARVRAQRSAGDLRMAIIEARKTHSVQEIADAMGVVRQRVYQLLKERPHGR